jgi:hypothetical protein
MKHLSNFDLNFYQKIFFFIGMVNLSAGLVIGCATTKRDLASDNCLNIGKSFGYDNETLIPLCSGVTTNESVYCYRDATMLHHLTKEQATEMCRPKLNIPIVK